MSNDIGIGPVGLPNVGGLARKPPHLLELVEGKTKSYFLSFDKPEFTPNFVQVKGVLLESLKEMVDAKDLVDYINSIPKDTIVEYYLPIHRILSIKNVTFKAK